MGMNGNGSATGLQSEINVTPLVDVVLVLLIIFMVVVPLMLEGYDVDTPKTSAQAPPTPQEVSQVILRVAPATCGLLDPPKDKGLPTDCHVTLNDQDIPVADLPARVKDALGGRSREERVLFLAADDRLNYEGVLRIVDLAKSGVDDLKIGVITTE
jgi:biopolymer transport protein ExbD